MKMNSGRFLSILSLISLISFSCANQTSTADGDRKNNSSDSIIISEQNVSYSADGITFNGFLAFDSSKTGKRPTILIVHEWWGLTDYTKNRARQLAKLGYVAMAVDMYGNGKIAADPKEAQDLATPFYKDPQLCKTRLDAALSKIKEFAFTDPDKIAAIGYCYGGFVVLNAAKLGADLKGVVSFHGDLSGVAPDKKLLKAKILVCHGGADQFVGPQVVDKFKHQMDSIGADYTFKVYPNATHAFTNPAATELGKKFNMPIAYNAEADKNSWNDMMDFFKKIF
ncbi:MAG TPA: dienelactone hydrolase family protein [Flavisolibacter sp.]|nr:dienelactone hydrolase family protein [Flavisolibacter sp.]